MKSLVFKAACALLLLAAGTARALGPQECVILVNRRSMASVELANFYADLRQVPAGNIIHLELPDKARDAGATFTPEEFRTHILEPTRRVMRERNIHGHVLVWLYSLDFPTIITTDPPMSLTGMTFVRGEPPPSSQILDGNWLSPLFTGPDREGGPSSPTASLENYTIALTTNMPVPSMMLGWSGSRGMTLEQIKDQLKASAASDGAQPLASAFFEINDNVRSTTRQWQFGSAVRELAGVGIAAFASSNAPAGRNDLIGVLSGRASLTGWDAGPLKPGAYADHLTSFAGLFHDPYQEKLTEWLKRGAAASSGTIAEPGSLTTQVRLWAKFPSARLFTHYAAGCTMIESLYQATRSPLQILLVGDALCNPWAKPPGITLINMADDEDAPVKGPAEFLASSWGGFGQPPPTTMFFIDGRPVNHPGNQPTLRLDSQRLHDGYHDLRVVAYAHEAVRHQGTDTLGFTVRNRNRWAELGGYEPRQKVDLYRPLSFAIRAAGAPVEVAIVAQERILVREQFTTNMALQIHPMMVGAGTVSFQVIAAYADKETVRSAPLPLDIQPLNHAPAIASIQTTTNSDGTVTAAMSVSDPESDPVVTFWYADLLRMGRQPEVATPENILQLDTPPGQLHLAATNALTCATYEIAAPNRLKELAVTVRTAHGTEMTGRHHGGLVFNYLDEKNYMFWGFDGHLDAWVLARMTDGVEERIFSRGAPIENDQRYRLVILSHDSRNMAFLVDDTLMGVVDASFSAGRIGVRAGLAVARFEQLHATPPSAASSHFAETGTDVTVKAEGRDQLSMLAAAARDVQLTTVTEAVPLTGKDQ